MKILFILPDVDSFHRLNIHFGIATLAGFLKANGYNDIRFLAVTSVEDYARIIREVEAYKPDIVGFTSVETQFKHVIALSEKIKEAHKCIVVLGGVFITLFPESVKDAKALDGAFKGESEQALLNFVRAVENGADYRQVNNFCYYDEKEGRVIQNRLSPMEDNLDLFGIPDRGIFDFQSVIDSYGGAAPFMFNRGCPYNCSFCSNHALASVYGRLSNKTRRRSVDLCIKEIKGVTSSYKLEVIHVWDDLFTSHRKWMQEFLDKYKKEVGLPFMCTTRSNLCDEELFKALKDGGCYRVHMSLESGNDFVRNKVMRRNISKAQIEKSFGLARKYGIEVSASSIIGLPFETPEMIDETIGLLGSLKVESCGVNIFHPYKGTHLYKVCEEYGMLVKEDEMHGIMERRESILNLPHVSREKLKHYFDNFEMLVRQKEGALPYLKCRLKATAKKLLPETIQGVIRKARKKKGRVQDFPDGLEE
ncbi:MAG: B12-binding domain-containing radical SAM protein [Deltaproteobacteria bacterium]|nr:B12-binding domain-containing radical SAM protein [Deltaproteobacteria bacterium]